LADVVRRDLPRAVAAEAVGTALLVAIVVGSGIFAERLSPHDVGLELLENSAATGAGLAALIMTFGHVSGAHFNPVVSLVERLRRRHRTGETLAYVAAQFAGGALGAVVANLMFGLRAVNVSTHTRSAGSLWLAEVVATFGLVVVIVGVSRSTRPDRAAIAVAGYIAAAYWFTSSTSFANPAVTVARTLSNSFAGIRPSSAPMFVVCEVAGGLLAAAFAVFVFRADADG
jgi:glycerol uptake facilitator-like aquaporin